MVSSTENIAIIPEFIDKYFKLVQIIEQPPVGNMKIYHYKTINILSGITFKSILQSICLGVKEINEILKKIDTN